VQQAGGATGSATTGGATTGGATGSATGSAEPFSGSPMSMHCCMFVASSQWVIQGSPGVGLPGGGTGSATGSAEPYRLCNSGSPMSMHCCQGCLAVQQAVQQAVLSPTGCATQGRLCQCTVVRVAWRCNRQCNRRCYNSQHLLVTLH
jgi:hypothetical protein